LRRVIFAFATRTPSALVAFCLSFVDVWTFPAVGIIGNRGVGTIDARSFGCVLIGPAVGLFFGMVDNCFLPNLFKRARAYLSPGPKLSNIIEKPAGLSRRVKSQIAV
jgi:hypothetical protein